MHYCDRRRVGVLPLLAMLIALVSLAARFTSSCAAAAAPDNVWFQGSLPAGAQPQVNAANCWQEPWTWVTDNPKPFSGSAGSQSTTLAGFHQHYFVNASQTMSVDQGDVLVAYVYLDPASAPTEVAVSWSDTGAPWDFKHRAFWGADSLASSDAVGSPDHYRAGDLPASGQWVRLEVSAAAVGLDGKVVNGIALAQFNGKSTWDHIGKRPGDGRAVAVISNPTVQAANIILSAQTSRPSCSTFAIGEPVGLTFHAKGLSASGAALSLHLSILDEYDAELVSRDIPVQGDAGGNWTTTIPGPSTRLGFYRVKVKLSNGVGIAALGSRGPFITYCVVPDPAERKLYSQADTHFGMQGGFNTTNSMLPYLGIRWVLGGYVWGDNEPNHAGQFAANKAAASGVFPARNNNTESVTYNGQAWSVYTLPTLYNNPPHWASIPETQGLSTAALSPAGEKGWADYCRAAALAYAQNYPNLPAHYYQITWEPVYSWGFKGTDEQLVKIYQIAYPILHSADPKAIVLGPTAASYDSAWESRLFEKGLGSCVDGVSIHPYTAIPPETGNLVENIRSLKAIARKGAGHDLPMFGTEQGSPTQQDPSAELRQAWGLLRQNLIMLGEGYGFNFAFYSTDYYRPDAPQESGFGYYYNLVHGEPFGSDSISPKPIAPAYAAQSFLLEGSHSNGQVGGLGDDSMGYSFERDGIVTLALWHYSDTPQDISLPVGAATIKLYDWMGNAKQLDAQNGYVTLKLANEPIYVVGASPAIWGLATERAVRLNTGGLTTSPGKSVVITGTVIGLDNRSESASLVVHGSDALHLPEISTPVTIVPHSAQPFRVAFTLPQLSGTGNFDLSIDLKDATGLVSSAQAELDVEPAVSLTSVMAGFDKSGQRVFRVKLDEQNGSPAKGHVQVLLANMPTATVEAPFELAPHQSSVIEIPEPDQTISPSAMYLGYVKVTMEDGSRVVTKAPLNFLSAPYVTAPPAVDGGISGWNGVAAITVAGRDAAVRSPQFYEDDLASTMRFAWDKDALYVSIVVSKDQHIQDNTEGMTWRGDSVQLDIDLDPQRRVTHTGNLTEDLGSTHRVTEINFALTKQGAQAYRSVSPDPTKLPCVVLGPSDLTFSAVPYGAGGVSYEAAIPWRSLGASVTPVDGDRIGIAVAVNGMKSSGQSDPTAIGLFDGVAGKDWTKYGNIVLTSK